MDNLITQLPGLIFKITLAYYFAKILSNLVYTLVTSVVESLINKDKFEKVSVHRMSIEEFKEILKDEKEDREDREDKGDKK